MKYTDVPRGNCVLFKNGEIVFHPLLGPEIHIQNRPFWYFKPYVVESGLLAEVDSTTEEPRKFGFTESGSMNKMRAQYGGHFPRPYMFPFWTPRMFSIDHEYGQIADATLCEFEVDKMVNIGALYDAYGTGDGTVGEYRIYLDRTDKSWYIRFSLSKSTYMFSMLCTFARDGQDYFSTTIYIGTSNPIHVSSPIPGNDYYEYTFGAATLVLPVEFSANGDTYGFLSLYDSDYAMWIYRYKSIYNPSGDAFAVQARFALGYPQSTGGTTFSKTTVDAWFGDYQVEQSDFDNPYDELVDDENQGGNDTNFGDNSDDITEDGLPDLDAIGTGFATIFTPTKSQLTNLSSVMWDSNVFTALQNLVENITNMFTSLSIVPFNVTRGSEVEVSWLGLPLTSIYLYLAAKQYYEFDLGDINLDDDNRIFKYDNCLDYSPFSKLGIYLPFIGFQELDIDECRNKVINLTYRIDILSGTCVAMVKLNGSPLYQFTGNCLAQIPITSESMQSLVTDAVNVGIAITNAKSAGAASSADIKAAEASGKGQAVKDARIKHAQVTQTHADTHLGSAAADAMMGLKPQYNKTGSVSATASLLSVKQPYLFLHTPKLSIPEKYQHFGGFPCNMTGTLGSFSGFTVVDSIRLNDLVATAPEVEEIYNLLKEGVII